jgi:hypothetical protein
MSKKLDETKSRRAVKEAILQRVRQSFGLSAKLRSTPRKKKQKRPAPSYTIADLTLATRAEVALGQQ